ncbi:9667_t:CDS:2, partial [Racocetra persica]
TFVENTLSQFLIIKKLSDDLGELDNRQGAPLSSGLNRVRGEYYDLSSVHEEINLSLHNVNTG